MILLRFRLISAYLIFFFFCIPTVAKSSNTNDNAQIEKELSNIVKLPDSEIDLFETLLLISKHWDPSLQIPPLRQEITNLISDVQKYLPGDTKTIIQSLRHAIHTKAGYRYTEQVDTRGIPVNNEELFLHGMLKTKRGYCMNLSLLYLILGQKLDLPLFGVPLPNHYYFLNEKGVIRINMEAT